MNRVAKRPFYANLDPAIVGKDKVFWKTFKPIFSEESNNSEKIVLLEDNTIISNDKEISDCFNSYFLNITDTLCLNEPQSIDNLIPFKDPVLNAVRKHENHPSIANIKINVRIEETFEFQPVSSLEVRNEINQLNRSKKTSGDPLTDITDIVKSISGSCLEYLTYFINQMVANSTFPNKLKLAGMSPIFKQGDSSSKKNFRPISVLSAMSKIFERLMTKQICPFAHKRLSNLLCGFRNGHSAEHALFRLTEMCPKALADRMVVGIVLMDLSKAYDCLPHEPPDC